MDYDKLSHSHVSQVARGRATASERAMGRAMIATRCIPLVHAKRARRPAAIKRGYSVCQVL